MNLQEMVFRLQKFWAGQGCVIAQPYDMEVGAGTMAPATFLRVLGPEPWNVAYVQPCRRPADGRYGENPNRLQHYYQYQVIMKPVPENIQEIYLESLKALDINPQNTTFASWRMTGSRPPWKRGDWAEVWLDGMRSPSILIFSRWEDRIWIPSLWNYLWPGAVGHVHPGRR